MTNGEKIKEIFPSTDSRLDEKTGIMLVKWVDGATKCFKADWWNAEYKEPTEKPQEPIDYKARLERLSKKAEIEILISQLRADRDRLLEVLDKIRADIENDWQLKKYPSSPFSCGLRRAIDIIDKYKAESEG